MWADHDARLAATRTLYLSRFGDIALPDTTSMNVLRGVEGRLMRKAYRDAAQRHGQKSWRRDTTSDDPANRLLNLGNSILYGSAPAAVTALGLSPALGVTHKGAANALLFDLADQHKSAATIPLAFECARLDEDVRARELRRRLRGYLHRNRVIAGHLRLLDEVLGPHLETDAGDIAGDTLIGEDGSHEVSGHTAHDRGEELPF